MNTVPCGVSFFSKLKNTEVLSEYHENMHRNGYDAYYAYMQHQEIYVLRVHY